MTVVISLGYFLLGFILVFFGGFTWWKNWDIFDIRIDDDDDNDYMY